eukprot:TRINITY_DN3163_c0_g1_i17.p1 TRINITY_DN3163_c0_g1~~TRINITY_DN3163_c0_g1_i17.p1  ORF type:complete len:409 (+),score=106.69 TRINITY_DN3163_c0_g1_i17:886-2112(+)
METRYNGDIRGAVNDILDSYQLKSLDALVEHFFESSNTAVLKAGGMLKLMSPRMAKKYHELRAATDERAEQGVAGMRRFVDELPNIGVKFIQHQALQAVSGGRNWERLYGNLEGDTGGWSAELWASDRIITCLGFKFNQTVFSGYSGESCSRSSCGPVSAKDLIKPTFLEGAVAELAPFEPKLAAEASGGDGMQDKPVRYPAQSYPALNSSWGAVALEDLYFAGELMHGADYRRGNGNLVHGFRHSVEALFNWLSWRRHNVPWPTRSSDFPVMTTVTSPNGSLVIEEQEGAATSLASAVLDLVDSPAGAHVMHGELVDCVLVHSNVLSRVRSVPFKALDDIISEYKLRVTVQWGWTTEEQQDLAPVGNKERRSELAKKIKNLKGEIGAFRTVAAIGHEEHVELVSGCL